MAEEYRTAPDAAIAEEQERRRAAQRQLVKAHKRLWNSRDGKIVLADMMKAFGFNKASYIYGAPAGDQAFRDGMKEPIRHAVAMRDTELAVVPKTARKPKAKSGLAERG
jgi:hypothetical protein